MKRIQTNNPYNMGKNVVMRNQNVSWNKNGIATIDNDDVADDLIKNFDDIFKEGQVPKKEEVKKISVGDEPSQAQFRKLELDLSDVQNEAASLLSDNKELKKKLEVAEADSKNWKDEYQKLSDSLKDDDSNESSIKEPADGGEDPKTEVDDDSKNQLEGMTISELKEAAKEMGIYDDVEDKRKPESFIKAILEAEANKSE